jgi:aspartyl protease family protein
MPRLRPPLVCLALATLAALATAWAQSVQLAGLAGGKALLVIDGQPPRFLSPGQSVGTVRLLEVTADHAVIETAGQRQTLRLGESPVASAPAAGGAPAGRVVLEAGQGGHFVSAGQVNGGHVEFMVDTGASVVSLGRPDADRLGIKLDPARRVRMNTANGQIAAFSVQLASVKLGEVTLYDVPAVVLPAAMPYVLLGNSFLSRFQLRRDNSTLTLDKRY